MSVTSQDEQFSAFLKNLQDTLQRREMEGRSNDYIGVNRFTHFSLTMASRPASLVEVDADGLLRVMGVIVCAIGKKPNYEFVIVPEEALG